MCDPAGTLDQQVVPVGETTNNTPLIVGAEKCQPAETKEETALNILDSNKLKEKEEGNLFFEVKQNKLREVRQQGEAQAKMRNRIANELGGFQSILLNPHLEEKFNERWEALSIYDCEGVE